MKDKKPILQQETHNLSNDSCCPFKQFVHKKREKNMKDKKPIIKYHN